MLINLQLLYIPNANFSTATVKPISGKRMHSFLKGQQISADVWLLLDCGWESNFKASLPAITEYLKIH